MNFARAKKVIVVDPKDIPVGPKEIGCLPCLDSVSVMATSSTGGRGAPGPPKASYSVTEAKLKSEVEALKYQNDMLVQLLNKMVLAAKGMKTGAGASSTGVEKKQQAGEGQQGHVVFSREDEHDRLMQEHQEGAGGYQYQEGGHEMQNHLNE